MADRYAATSIEDYFAVIPPQMRTALEVVWDRIKRQVPDAGEHFGYGIPIVDYRGKGLVGLSAAASGHCSLHLMSPPAASALKDRLREGRLSGATLQFSPSEPLSEDTVAMIVAYRMAEADALSAEKAAKKAASRRKS